jgi:hypothetical protein
MQDTTTDRVPNRRRVFVFLVLAFLAAAGTAFQTYRFDQQVARDRALEDSIKQQLDGTELALADLRHAQAAYVAVGQGSVFWLNAFEEALVRVESPLRERQQTTSSAGALSHYDAAIEQIGALRTSDGRARNYVRGDQLILASDVVFVESLEIIGRISANLSAARATEVLEVRQGTALVTQYRMALGGGGLLFVLLVAMLAYRETGVGGTVAESLSVVPEPVTPVVAARVPAPGPAAASPHLTETADVCVDLARLLDGQDLPALLGRAAAAMGAKGLVLWIVDESGQTLRATVAHGYSDRMLQRLGTLPVSADNVTSRACRTQQAQVVAGETSDNAGAHAVPFFSSAGCVGVLSAEVAGIKSTGHHLPIARMIAAQLSAVVRPESASLVSTATP